MDHRRWRARSAVALPGVLTVVAVVAGLLLATGTATPAVAYAQAGHWVVNAAERSVVHVDSGTAQVDARVELPAEAEDPVFALQGERQGFVVGREQITVFGRSTLTVDSSIPVEFDELPVGIETLGGPYLVYRTAGTIVRLGVPALSLPVGGSVERPVWTDDGTVWLHRPDVGSLCALRAGAQELDCSSGVTAGEPGGLTVTEVEPAYVGTRRDAAQVVDRTLGAPVGLGTDMAEAGLLADRDTEGRLAVVEPGVNRLVLADSAGVPAGIDGGPAVAVDLGPGEFSSPLAADGVIAVLDLDTNRLLTFAVDGAPLATAQLPPGEPPTLTRGGDGRIYVDDAGGANTHVVGPGGVVTSVSTGGVLPGAVAVAAPPERSSPVAPPPARVPGTTPGLPGVPPPAGTGPGTGLPNPAPVRPSPVRPPDPVLPPPTAVTARAAAGGAVTVSWAAVTTATSYVVRGGGQTRTTGATTVTLTGLPVGRPATFTVQAVSGAARSVESAAGAPATPFDTPGAPTGFTAAPTCAQSCEAANLRWQAPDLAGGQLVHYLLTGAQNGRPLRTQTVGTPAARYVYGDDYTECGVIVFAVQAVTTTPGSDDRATGPEAVYTFGGFTAAQCTPTATVDGATVDGLAVTVGVQEGSTGRGTCTIELDGIGRDTRACGRDPLLAGFSQTAEERQYGATIDGLQPDTTYSITVTASNDYGATTSAAVLVTTGPAA